MTYYLPRKNTPIDIPTYQPTRHTIEKDYALTTEHSSSSRHKQTELSIYSFIRQAEAQVSIL